MELDNTEELPYLQSCDKIYLHKYEILSLHFYNKYKTFIILKSLLKHAFTTYNQNDNVTGHLTIFFNISVISNYDQEEFKWL